METMLPLTKDDVKGWRAGDVYELTGSLYTARDAAHARMAEKGEAPVDLRGQTVMYAGPCPARPGFVIGPLGPTTSARLDRYIKMTLDFGVTAMIGKGERSPEAAQLIREYSAVYLLMIGGAAAIYSRRVNSCETVAYEDLGTESVKRLGVSKLKVIVGIDPGGGVLQDIETPKYRLV